MFCVARYQESRRCGILATLQTVCFRVHNVFILLACEVVRRFSFGKQPKYGWTCI